VVDQKIEPPTEADVDAIARALIHAEHVVHEGLGRKFDGSVQREATYTLQALGLAFGRVLLTENPGYDWWMVEDEYCAAVKDD
jgi:predicted alpha-1,6-mannanase (GH76 family)